MLLLKLAFRNIFRQRRRSLLTAMSMAGGYLLCALSVSLSEGSYNNAIRFFTLDHTGHIQIHQGNYLKRPKIYKTINDLEDLSQVLDANDDIQSHTLRVFAPALAYSKTDNSPVQVVGVDLEREKSTSRLMEKVMAGTYINNKVNSDGYYSTMIGQGIANSLKIALGDELILISQGADGSIANDIYIVRAFIGKKDSGDKSTVFLPLIAAQDFLGMYGKAHEFAILLKNDKKARKLAASLQDQLTALTVSPWQVVEATFYKSMQADKEGMNFTLGIVVFIVFIGVLNTVMMSVLERTREFGVLKAIGSRPSSILKLITLETGLLAIMSILVGLVLALPVIAWFAFVGIELSQPIDMGGIKLSYYTGEMSMYVFGAPMIAVLCFAILVSIPTGLRAASISPTEAMRSH